MNSYRQMAELQQKWTPPPELAGSGPRETRLTGQGIGMVVLATVLFAGGMAATVGLELVAQREAGEQKLLREQGVETPGTIVRLWRARDKERQPMMSYTFSVDRVTYRRNVKLPLRTWKTRTEGAPLAIRYVPSNPSLNRPADRAESPLPYWVPLLIGAVLGGLGALVLVVLRRTRQLLAEGRAAPAIVIKHSIAQHGHKQVHYQFPLLGGSPVTGKSGPSHKPAPIGATLCVIYDRENPRRNTPYPMDLVRLANLPNRTRRSAGGVS